MEIKSAEQILEKWYNPLHGIGEIAKLQIIEAMKEYAKLIGQKSLENASNKSQEMLYYIDDENTTNVGILNLNHRRLQTCYAVPKQTILNKNNIPLIK